MKPRHLPLLATLAFAHSATAQEIIKANNTDALNLGTSWGGGTAPGSSDVAVWNNTVTAANSTNLGGALSWAGIRIADPGGLVTINHSAATTLTLGSSGINMSAATQNLTFGANAGLVIGANQTWNIARGRTLTLGRATTGSGNLNLTSTGTTGVATVNWTSSTAYAGQLTIGENVLVSSSSSGAWLGTQTVKLNGGQVALAPNASVGWSNAFEIQSGTTASTIINNATSTGAIRSIALNGVISGGGTGSVLTFRNNGYMPFNGATDSKGFIITRNSTFQGTLRVEDGTGNTSYGSFLRIGADRSNDNDGRNYGNGGNNGSLHANAAIELVHARSVMMLMRNDAHTFANNISGAGELWVGHSTIADTTTDSQVVTLSGTNTYTGVTRLLSGTIKAGSTSALGNGSGGTTVASGATLDLNGFAIGAEALTLGGGTLANTATEAASSSGTISLSSGTSTLAASSDITLSGVLSGTGGIEKTGDGTLTLTAASNYTGATTITSGSLTLGGSPTVGTGNLNDASDIHIASGAALRFTRTTNDTGIGNAISGTGTIVKTGTNEIGFTGVNTFSGLIDIQQGKAGLTGVDSENGKPAVNIASGATFSLGTGFSTGTATIGNLTGAGNVDTAFGGSNDTRTLSITQTTDATFSGRLMDASSSRILAIQKEGAATLTLTATNHTFTGATTINAGTLEIGGAGVLGNGSYAGAITNNATLRFDSTANQTLSGALSGSGTLLKSNTGTLILTANNSYTGGITIEGGTLQIGNNTSGGFIGNDATVVNNAAMVWHRSNDTNVGNHISGTGTITKLGGGILSLNGTNTYTGTTTISGGTLRIGGGGTSGTLGTGDVVNNAALLFNRSDDFTVGNDISGTGTLTKEGAGVLTLTGSNTHTGTTLVSAGTLLVNGSLGNTAVIVNANAIIGGIGALDGSLSFAPTSLLEVVDFNDPLAVAGNITFGSGFGIANLTGIDWDSLAFDTPYTVLSTTQTFGTGDIANFGIANAVTVGTGRYAYFQNGSLAVVVIPEPAAALLGGLGLLTLLRRRR